MGRTNQTSCPECQLKKQSIGRSRKALTVLKETTQTLEKCQCEAAYFTLYTLTCTTNDNV
eukprot:m.92525 g.92525  ORF g.92525 m.92525 type:complete len:60 (-) comp12357_c2_seq6:117-296(-)